MSNIFKLAAKLVRYAAVIRYYNPDIPLVFIKFLRQCSTYICQTPGFNKRNTLRCCKKYFLHSNLHSCVYSSNLNYYYHITFPKRIPYFFTAKQKNLIQCKKNFYFHIKNDTDFSSMPFILCTLNLIYSSQL